MSAISGFINQILNAVYGEEVRSSIVGALEQCYSDVTNPDLNTEAFETALREIYDEGILDIQTVTLVSQMTNQNIIYRYNGTESGYTANTLYYYNGTAWVPIGSGIRTASTAAQMTDTSTIYKYTGNESGYTQNALYYYNGTAWVEIVQTDTTLTQSGVPADAKTVGDKFGEYSTASFSDAASANLFDPDTMIEDKVITDSGISASTTAKIAVIPVTAGKHYAAQSKTLAWSTGSGLAFLDSTRSFIYFADLTSTIIDDYARLNKASRIFPPSKQGTPADGTVSRDVTEKGISFTVPTGAAYVAIQIARSGYDSTDSFMIEEGESCGTYVPYLTGSGESVVSIFNHTIADAVLRALAIKKTDIEYSAGSGGKNLFDIASMMVGGYVCSSSGFEASNAASNVSVAVVPVTGGLTYSIQKKYASWAAQGVVALLDSNMTQVYAVQINGEATNGDYKYPTEIRVLSAVGQPTGVVEASADSMNKGLKIITSENTAYLAFNLYLTGAAAYNVQVEKGGACTDYESYAAAGGTEISKLCGLGLADEVARAAIGIDDGGSSSKPYSGVEWVTMGDSITVGGGSGGGYYVNEVTNKLGFTTINAAESGVHISAALTQANAITGATKIATIMLGTNNSTETAETIGQIGDTTMNTIHGQIYMIINKILTEHPAVYFGFITPVPRYRSASQRESVRMVSEAIVEACKYYCIPCLDLQTSIGFAEQAKDIYYMDNVHPSAAGTHRMALAIEAWLTYLLGDM